MKNKNITLDEVYLFGIVQGYAGFFDALAQNNIGLTPNEVKSASNDLNELIDTYWDNKNE